MKKVIIAILVVLLVGAGVAGTIYFYIQNKNQISANEQLAAQNASVQAQLNAIGAMVEVYEVNKNVYSGGEILQSDLIAVSIPASTLADSSVTDINLLLGRHYRVNIKPGTILSLDMLMDEDEDTSIKYPYELTLQSIPVSTVPGDYVDLRMIIPNGEEYVVLNHKRVERLYNTTLTINVSEEEIALINAMLHDLGTYQNGCIAYVTKFLEPGNMNTIAFYPVQADMENLIRFNPNIEDVTRCINSTLRAHIDEVFLVYTDSANQNVANNYISNIRTQLSGQLNAQQLWIAEHTNEEGEFVGENGENSDDNLTFDQNVGEAIDGLENSITDLEAIQ